MGGISFSGPPCSLGCWPGVIQREVTEGKNQRALYTICVLLEYGAPVVEQLVNKSDVASFE
jgi:hypothetical protein